MNLGKILLIDDKIEISTDNKAGIETFCRSEGINVDVEIWEKAAILSALEAVKAPEDDDSNATEDQLFRVFKGISDLDLVIVDRDLSGIQNIISESAVINACLQAGIPVCTYHRKPPNKSSSGNLSQVLRQSTSYSISVEVDENFAKNVVEVGLAFRQIYEAIPSDFSEPLLTSPSRVLASILGLQNISIYLDQYAQSSSLASFILAQSDDLKIKDSFYRKRLAFLLGCWLHNHILAFPGVILNEVSTYSYINIDEGTFTKYKNEFKSARYAGPFGNFIEYWVRIKLDESHQEQDDAFGFLKAKYPDDDSIKPCRCSIDSDLEAGFYCVINKKPISLQKSVGSLAWIPEGADLCRVDRDTYDQLAPLMGL